MWDNVYIVTGKYMPIFRVIESILDLEILPHLMQNHMFCPNIKCCSLSPSKETAIPSAQWIFNHVECISCVGSHFQNTHAVALDLLPQYQKVLGQVSFRKSSSGCSGAHLGDDPVTGWLGDDLA